MSLFLIRNAISNPLRFFSMSLRALYRNHFTAFRKQAFFMQLP